MSRPLHLRGHCLQKPPDIVGELKSAEIFASHLPSLKAKELEKLT
jgi:hypothetical protein